MWKLQSTINKAVAFPLVCNKDLIVGRRDADIVLSGDSSVSRKHAKIMTVHNLDSLKNPDNQPKVTLQDSSKFGTFLTRIGSSEKVKVTNIVTLHDGDTIQFGGQNSIFKVLYEPLVVTTSMLEPDIKRRLQETVLSIGGHIVNKWHDKVTHVVVAEIKLSVKVTQALANGCHIVTPEYIFKLGEMEKVDPDKFLPELAEPNLSKEHCCFKVNERRKSVFSNKTFFYCGKKQMRRLGTAITYGGGQVLLLDNSTINDSKISHPETAIIQFGCPEENDVNKRQYEHVLEVLQQHNMRLIQEHEIGLAVLYCDTSVYCNASFDLNSQNMFTQKADIGESQEKQGITPATIDISVNDKVCWESQKQNKKRVRVDENLQLLEDGCIDLTENKEENFKADEITSGPTSATKRPRLLKSETQTATKIPQNEQVPTLPPNNNQHNIMDAHVSLHKLPAQSKASNESAVSNVMQENELQDIPDSFLDDDNLWSQNFESQSFTGLHHKVCEEVKSPTSKFSLTNEKENPLINIKTEIKSPSVSRFSTIRNGRPELVEEIKCEMSPQREHDVNKEAPVNKESVIPSIEGFGNPEPKVKIKSLAKVTLLSLIAKKHHAPRIPSHGFSRVKNLKRFQKVWPTYMNVHSSYSGSSHPVIPRIIGGSDLFAHKKYAERNCDLKDWLKSDLKSKEHFDASQSKTNPFLDIV